MDQTAGLFSNKNCNLMATYMISFNTGHYLLPYVSTIQPCFSQLFVFFPSSERQVFLATWKDIPNENELQYQIKECHLNAGRQVCE